MLPKSIGYKLAKTVSMLALIAFGGAVTLGHAATVDIYPGADIPSVVNAHPAGTTFVIHPGVYRMQRIVAKDGDTFIGQPGTILNGSRLLTTFSQVTINGISYWIVDGPNQPGVVNGACDPLFPMCKYPEELFIDSKPLLRVSSLSQVVTGKCYFDYAFAKIYFLDTPTGHTVEASVTPVAFEQGPINVTIEGLVIEKYANPGPDGAIGDQDPGSGWIVENSDVRLNHGTGIKVGNGSQVLNNKIHDNGQIGFGTYKTDGVLLQNNEIARNNRAGFRVTYGAGGAKVGAVYNFTARGNYIHDNVGTGLWCDGCYSGVLFDSNLMVNNAKNGISDEISTTTIIRNNVVIGNGFGTPYEWMGGAGINLPNSDHAEVANNFVANNRYGIRLTKANRKDAPSSDLNNNYVHDNVVVMIEGYGGLLQSVGDDAYFTSKNNRFVNNRYCIPSASAQVYAWMDNFRTAASWKAYGQDVDGQWACPAVFISSPVNAATVSGKITVSAAAADTTSVTKVEFYVGGALMATSTISPYSFAWDTTKETNSAHTVEAKAYNTADQSSSTFVTVTIKNP